MNDKTKQLSGKRLTMSLFEFFLLENRILRLKICIFLAGKRKTRNMHMLIRSPHNFIMVASLTLRTGCEV